MQLSQMAHDDAPNDPFSISLLCDQRFRENKVQTVPLRSSFHSVDQQEARAKRLDEGKVSDLLGGFKI